eukprot:gene5343-6663_t
MTTTKKKKDTDVKEEEVVDDDDQEDDDDEEEIDELKEYYDEGDTAYLNVFDDELNFDIGDLDLKPIDDDVKTTSKSSTIADSELQKPQLDNDDLADDDEDGDTVMIDAKEKPSSTITTTTTSTTSTTTTAPSKPSATGPLPKFDIDNIPYLKKGDTQKKETVKKKRDPSKPKKVSKEVQSIISKGNQAYSEGDYTAAHNYFAEVIRLDPSYHIAYNIIGAIKEKRGDKDSALTFLFYAAQIKGIDPTLWARCGRLAKQLQKDDQATYCYSRAMKLDPTDLDSIYERGQLHVKKREYKKALKCFDLILKETPGNPQILTEIAQILIESGSNDEAIERLQSVVENDLKELEIDQFHWDSFNLLFELYNKCRDYNKAITLYQRLHAKVPKNFDLPIDLISNGCMAFYSSGNMQAGDTLLQKVLNQDEASISDIYLDLANHLVILEEYKKALVLLDKLHRNSECNTIVVWRKIGHCHKMLKNYPLAIQFFQKSLEVLPNTATSLALSEIYKEMGDNESALRALNQSESVSLQHIETEKEIYSATLNDLVSKRAHIKQEQIRVYWSKAESFFNLSKYPQFLGISLALLHGSNDKLKYMKRVGIGSRKKKPKSFKKKKHKTSYSQEIFQNLINPPFAELLEEEEYFITLQNTAKVLSFYHRYSEASGYLRYALNNLEFTDPTHAHQLKFIIVGIAYNDKNFKLAYKWVKYVCIKKPSVNRTWNLYNKILLNSAASNSFGSQKRFLYAVRAKHPNCIPLLVILGNQCKITGNASGALKEYIKAYKLDPYDPLINLLIGTTLLSQTMNRVQPDRHKIVITAFSFLYKYLKLRGETQEAYFNLARAYHQLNISYLAIDYYQKVLEMEDDNPEHSLKKESAFNLSLIYKNSGETYLANEILRKYIVI